MSSLKQKCEQYFGTSNFYEILNVSKDAGEKEIKKAYYKLSLVVHPDRVDEKHKEVATEKFKVLGQVHSILQDKDKRNSYDDFGDYDDDEWNTSNWKDYWSAMFKKIEIEDIKKYENEYVGSDIERRDIKRAYEGGKGNMDTILELVPFSSCADEPRIMEIVREMIDNGEVEEYPAFFNESKVKKQKRHRKWEKERKEAEQINMEELEERVQNNIKKQRDSFFALLSDIETKYAQKKKRAAITDSSEKKSKRSRRK